MYSARFLMLKLMETDFRVRFDDREYSAETRYRTKGPLSWVTDEKIQSEAGGRIVDGGETLAPSYYRHHDVLKKKERSVALDFTENDIEATITPPFGSMGEPPATQKDRAGAMDLVSGMMQLAMNIGDDPAFPCGRDIPIFDGKQRYNFRLASAGSAEADLEGYSGAVIACDVWFIPLVGFDPEDVPDEKWLNRPLTVWFTDAPDQDFHIPVYFRYDAGIGELVIEAREVNLGPAAEQRAER